MSTPLPTTATGGARRPARRSDASSGTRTKIALTVIIAGFAGIVAIAGVTLWLTTDKGQSAQLVFTSVIPLIGTWVGAVLAFYFSRDNQQAASDTTLDAIDTIRATGVDGEATVASVMTSLNRIQPREDVSSPDAAKSIKLRSLYEAMRSSGRSRVPIFVDQVALLVVHEPDIDKYAQGRQVSADSLPDEATVEQLLADPDLGRLIGTFATVSSTATLADARREIAKLADCKDVFVTTDGQKTGRVVGWLTNSDLARAV
jgi:hypothetical protein